MPMTMFGQLQVVAASHSVLVILFSLMSMQIPSAQALTTDDPLTLAEEYEAEEFVTEVYTEVISTTEPTSDKDTGKSDTQKPEYPGDSFVTVQFKITNREMADDESERALEVEIVSEVTSLCRRFEDFLSVIVLGFHFSMGSVITEVAVLFSRKLDSGEENEVFRTFYEAVELNGTIGSLAVETMFVLDTSGEYRRIEDACDIVHCINDIMICSSEGLHCISTCEDNKDYCQNNSTCLENKSETNFIECSCTDGYRGTQCEIPPRARSRPYSENVFVGLIAAASVVLFCLILLLAFILCSRIRRKRSEYRSDIYPAENVIALEMSSDYYIVGGVGCQTDDSFLLTQYMMNGIPPKPGFSHSVMQTTDSFLLAKSQGRVPYVKKGKTAPAPSAPTPTKLNGATNTSEKQPVEVDVSDKKHMIEKVKQPEADGGLDNKGAFNEGFLKDEEPEPIQPVAETEDDMKDPKRIVKV